MNPLLTPLVALQTLDRQILELTEQQRKIPQQLEAAEAPLKDSRSRLQAFTSSADALTKDRRSYERDLEIHEGQIQKMRGRLSELKTNKEYQAHLFEIEMANKKKSEIEDQILGLMERIERAQQEITQIQAQVTENERAYAEEQKRLHALGENLSLQLAELQGRRQELLKDVDPVLLGQYNRVKAMRKDAPLAPVRNGICFGCRLQLPPQLVAEVKRSSAIQSCSYCHRILYWEEESAPAQTPEQPQPQP